MEEVLGFFTDLFDSIFSDDSEELPVEANVQILGTVDADGDGVFGGLLLGIDSNGDKITDYTAVAYGVDANHDGEIDAVRVDYRDTSLALNEAAEDVQYINVNDSRIG
jgi:hypothetical protein